MALFLGSYVCTVTHLKQNQPALLCPSTSLDAEGHQRVCDHIWGVCSPSLAAEVAIPKTAADQPRVLEGQSAP